MTMNVAPVRMVRMALGAGLAGFASGRAPGGFRAAQRMAAAICLPAALASVLSGLCPALSAAAIRPGLRTEIEAAASSPAMVLELVNGQSLSGAFNGFVGDWRDTVDSAVRYAAWWQAQPAGVPRLGERVVLELAAGDTLRGTLEGVGPSFLAIGTGNTRYSVPVEFGTIDAVRSDGGAALAPWSELRTRLLDAPPFIGVGLVKGTTSMLISRESILSARGSQAPRASANPSRMVFVAVGIVAVVLVCASAVSSANSSAKRSSSSLSSCTLPYFDFQSQDARFGASDVSHGVVDWAPGETRRP